MFSVGPWSKVEQTVRPTNPPSSVKCPYVPSKEAGRVGDEAWRRARKCECPLFLRARGVTVYRSMKVPKGRFGSEDCRSEGVRGASRSSTARHARRSQSPLTALVSRPPCVLKPIVRNRCAAMKCAVKCFLPHGARVRPLHSGLLRGSTVTPRSAGLSFAIARLFRAARVMPVAAAARRPALRWVLRPVSVSSRPFSRMFNEGT